MARSPWLDFTLIAAMLASLLVAVPVRAEGDGGGRRGDPGWRQEPLIQISPEQRQFLRERRQAARNDRVIEVTPVDRRFDLAPDDERQRFGERRRQMRQLSIEERQQLRRDILEANRGGYSER